MGFFDFFKRSKKQIEKDTQPNNTPTWVELNPFTDFDDEEEKQIQQEIK